MCVVVFLEYYLGVTVIVLFAEQVGISVSLNIILLYSYTHDRDIDNMYLLTIFIKYIHRKFTDSQFNKIKLREKFENGVKNTTQAIFMMKPV